MTSKNKSKMIIKSHFSIHDSFIIVIIVIYCFA